MRPRYAIANWKMNLPPDGIESYLSRVEPPSSTNVVIAPPFPYLKDVADRVASPIAVGAQNCADQRSGAFTGEVSPTMLRERGVQYVILGHSERRNVFGETDELIARKLSLAIEAGLRPVLCVGEDQRVRDAGRAETFVADQLRSTAVPALENAGEVILAYEPIWAIGTGRNATGAMVAEMVTGIREALGRFWPRRYATATPLLYGGSVTPDNIDDIGENSGVDGYLVGGASLDCIKFTAICRGTARLRSS